MIDRDRRIFLCFSKRSILRASFSDATFLLAMIQFGRQAAWLYAYDLADVAQSEHQDQRLTQCNDDLKILGVCTPTP